MNNYKSLIALAALTACGTQPVEPGQNDPELVPFALAFEHDASAQGLPVKAVPMVFAEIPGIARCGWTQDRGPMIEINRTKFEAMAPETKLIVVLHEQGHCVFNLEHTAERTLMSERSPSVLTDDLLKGYWKLARGE